MCGKRFYCCWYFSLPSPALFCCYFWFWIGSEFWPNLILVLVFICRGPLMSVLVTTICESGFMVWPSGGLYWEMNNKNLFSVGWQSIGIFIVFFVFLSVCLENSSISWEPQYCCLARYYEFKSLKNVSVCMYVTLGNSLLD